MSMSLIFVNLVFFAAGCISLYCAIGCGFILVEVIIQTQIIVLHLHVDAFYTNQPGKLVPWQQPSSTYLII